MTSGNNIETEYKNINAKNEWQTLYQRIRDESITKDSICTEASKPQNKCLNRYRDVNPYDHSRIVLKRGSTDYINANLIRVEKARRRYILTQGPLVNTVSHFWLMVWEQGSKAVLMLNKLIEKKAEKCYQYWPSKMGSDHIMHMDDVGLSLEYMEQQDHSYYLTRVLKLTDTATSTSRDILQFHYTTWPDFGVPTSPTVFLAFLCKVRDAGVLQEDVGPAIVHCSAGIGRSGTFCLVDSCLVLIEKFGLNSVDVKQVLFEMRKYRMGLIQTPEQLRFSYEAIIEGAKRLLDPDSTTKADEMLFETMCDNNFTRNSGSFSDEDEPPPLPPPRHDSLNRPNGEIIDRPLPKIPNSLSLPEDQFADLSDIPRGPLPLVPPNEEEGSSEDELECEYEEERSDSPCSVQSNETESKELNLSPSEVRQRRRVQHKEKLEAQVREMKRRQQANEQWTQLKRPKTSLQD